MGKFFWVGLKINNPTRIMDISRNPSRIVGIAKALLKLWILCNVHKACEVILSRLLKGNRYRLFIGHYRKTIPLSDSLPPDYPTLFSGLMVSGR
jgi:hypothetical protein